ncbi:GAF domain-containing protein [Thermophagus xiamenensis]|jgi:hypothetical protein|uniref:GAF domain-containing protein n=1 Tax=Thermophagus xiamenensis TaxID=385682 RepID=A0A1I1ZCT6_9BACT|nr:GAF domain-containing protein [Thermophagus xiamenensis]SFE29138.1 GAF domain-containing protein [Thermophagus xiamenensis]
MIRHFFNNHNFQKWLFLFGGIAFTLSLFKNVFLSHYPGTSYYLVETLAFLFFLAAFYISDKNNQFVHLQLKKYKNKLEDERIKSEQKIRELENLIAEYARKDDEEKRFVSYQDKIIQKLVTDSRVQSDKHHFLFLLIEFFQGMAAIWYKKEEPDNQFNVEASFGLPEDFEPKPFVEGDGLNGQAVTDKKPLMVKDVPADYVSVETALGKSKNYFLYLLPILKEGECVGLIEIMTFKDCDAERHWPAIMEQLIKKNIL